MIVHSQILDLGEYYEENQVFDSWDNVKAAGILRLVGILFNASGDITREFKQTYDEQTGETAGTRNYAYREHLPTDERSQKALALLESRRKRMQSRGPT